MNYLGQDKNLLNIPKYITLDKKVVKHKYFIQDIGEFLKSGKKLEFSSSQYVIALQSKLTKTLPEKISII